MTSLLNSKAARIYRYIHIYVYVCKCVCINVKEGTVPVGFASHRRLSSIRSDLPLSLSPTLRNSLLSALEGHVLRSRTVGAKLIKCCTSALLPHEGAATS